MHSTHSEDESHSEKRADGARLIVESLAHLADQRGLVLDDISWFTHPSQDAALGTYTLLLSTQQKLEELVFLGEELESLPQSTYTQRRIDRSLRWLLDALSA